MATILIVDDERCLRVTLQAFLRGAGHDVTVAENARLAVQMLDVAPFFDVVISDIGLPDMDGFRLCETMRQSAPRAKMILMTGDPTADAAGKAARAGAERFLTKPVSEQEICKVVDDVIGTTSQGSAQPGL